MGDMPDPATLAPNYENENGQQDFKCSDPRTKV